MKQIRIGLLIVVCALCGALLSRLVKAQYKSGNIDWKSELTKAKAEIDKNPKSSFWHNQAGVAYDALGDNQNAVKELKLACTLDPSNPINYYTLYGIYKRRAMLPEQREVLLEALEKDTNNPLGHFGFGLVLEKERHWGDSLREYQKAKLLAASLKGPTYTDPRGNAYDVGGLEEEVDSAINRVTRMSKSTGPK